MKTNLLDIQCTQIENGVVVRLVGDLDASSCKKARAKMDRILSGAAGRLLVNCSELQYVSSAGLGTLLFALRKCQKNNVPFILFDVQPKIRNIMELIGMHQVVTVAVSEQEALALTTEDRLTH